VTWQVTINDPGAWYKPWTAVIPLRLTNEFVAEYACHEGNYGLRGILAGARAQEQSGK
jgi:hypothetical protein